MTAYTIAIDDTVAGWKTVDWAVATVDADVDRVRLTTVSEFTGEPLSRSGHRLDAARRRLRETHPGLRVTRDITGGPVGERLVSDSGHSEVLVIGGRQVGTLAAALTGRVAERVVAHATSPVVVVPERWEPSGGPVIVGVDGRSAASALAWAADRAERVDAELCLVRAWSVPTAMAPYANIHREQDMELWAHEADLELRAALQAVAAAHPTVPTSGTTVEGQPRDVVLHASHGASLVVVGRRHRTALGGFLAGSVGEQLMHRGQAPVCIVPEPKHPKQRDHGGHRRLDLHRERTEAR